MASWFRSKPSSGSSDASLEKQASDLLGGASDALRGLVVDNGASKAAAELVHPYVGRRHTLVPDVLAEHVDDEADDGVAAPLGHAARGHWHSAAALEAV